MKKIFTPFSVKDAGLLATVLEYKAEIQKRNTRSDSEEYRGFKPADYVFAPPKEGNTYQPTHQLEQLTKPTDQLYINGHCNAGLDYLSTNAACNSELKVTVDDLVSQIMAQRLQDTSAAKIKLWVCKGGLEDGDSESFAVRFSRKMWSSGYRHCKIFGYRRSVFQKYMKDGSDEYHKWAAVDTSVRSPEEVIALAIQGTDADSKRAKMIWETELRITQQDHGVAIANITNHAFKRKSFPGLESAARVGPRASDPTVRVQFLNGQAV